MAALAFSFTFLTVFLGIFALNLALTDVYKHERKEVERRMQSQIRERDRFAARQSVRQKQDADGALSELARQAELERTAESPWERFTEFVAQSGLKTSPWKIVATAAGIGIVFALASGLLLRNVFVGLGTGALLSTIPFLYVFIKRRKRLDEMRRQLPDALDLMSRILRAGQTVVQAMNAIAEEFKPPLGIEFGYCYEQQNLGLSTEVALRDLAKRTGLIEIKIFVLAVLVHRQSGGNLTELLEKLAKIVRERFRLRGEIRSLTAEGRMQAAVLIGLPFVVWLALSVLNPTYAFKLFDHPWVIVTMLVMMFVGSVWINRIVNFDF